MSASPVFFSGIRFAAISTGVSFGIGLLQTAVLTRLLDKSDFAWIAISSIFINIGIQIQNSSINTALLQRPDNTPNQLSSLFWLNQWTSSVFLFIGMLLALLVGKLYQSATLTTVFALHSLIFITNGMGIQQKTMLQKYFRFKDLAIVEIIGVLGSFAIAVLLAWQGWGVWAIVTSYLMRSLLETVFSWWYNARIFLPQWHFQWQDIKPYYHVSAFVSLERLVTHFVSQLDMLLITKWLGVESAGVYDVFKRTILRPAVLLNLAFEKVALPAFSSLQHDKEKLANTYSSALNLSLSLHLLLYIPVMLLAPWLVKWYFGISWGNYTFVFQSLCIFAILYAWINPLETLLIALGKIQYQLFLYLLLAPTLILGIYFGSRYTLEVTTVYINIIYLVTSFLFYWIIKHHFLPLLSLSITVMPILLATISLLPAIFLYSISLFFAVLLFSILYLYLTYWLNAEALKYVVRFIRNK